jgi:hypothetical protein
MADEFEATSDGSMRMWRRGEAGRHEHEQARHGKMTTGLEKWVQSGEGKIGVEMAAKEGRSREDERVGVEWVV